MSRKVQQALVELKIEDIGRLVREELESGSRSMEILEVLRKGMKQVGEKFESGEYFLSELIMAGETMKEALNVLTPFLSVEKATGRDKIILGTILGDLHDIGKEIVKTLLISAGFEVYDLGIDVPPEEFVEKAMEVDAKIIGVSALLSTTLPTTAKIVKRLKKAGIRDKVKVIIGGAAVREYHVEMLGVDAAVNDAVKGVDIIKSWVGRTK